MSNPAVPGGPLPWGTDGAVPIKNWDTDPLFKVWAKDQIYMGDEAEGRYIPKIFDNVFDRDFLVEYQVTGLTNQWVPILKRITPKPIADVESEDLLLGQTNDSFRCYIDKESMPHRLQVDGRCYVNARNASGARVYRGNPINGVEEIVSLVLDQSGMSIGTIIPLQLCYTPNGQNVAQYYVPTAYTTTDIKDGEFLYVVLYDDTGAVLSSRGLRAVVTSFTHSHDVSLKAVTGIALEGPLMDPTVPNRLEVPLNLTLDSINLRGVVNYNSGSSVKYNVDGSKFDLLGLGTFIPTQAGQRFKLNLKYQLSQGEVSFTGGAVGPDRFIIEPIDVVVTDVENQLTVKLYPYPVWNDSEQQYRLRWFMCNLDRNAIYDVTGVVEMGVESPAFDPTLYGQRQQLTAVIDLSTVNGGWRSWRHVQTFSITLIRPGNRVADGTPWRIRFDPNQNPEFGENNVCRAKLVNQNLFLLHLNIQSNYETKEDWLESMYYRTRPLTNPRLENAPIAPTHFVITDGSNKNVKFNIDQWNQNLTINFMFGNYSTLWIKFIKQGPTSDLVLSVTGIPVQYVTNL